MDEMSQRARQLLAAARRSERLTDDRARRIWRSLEARLQAPTGPASTHEPPAADPAGPLTGAAVHPQLLTAVVKQGVASKLLIAAVAGLGLAGTVLLWRGDEQRGRTSAAPPVSGITGHRAPGPRPAQISPPAPAPQPPPPQEVTRPAPAPPRSRSARHRSTRLTAPTPAGPARRATRDDTAIASPGSKPGAEPVVSTPASEQRRETATGVADGAVPDAGAAGERGTLRAELRIIAAARRALDGNLLTQAATALAQHAARFPRGQLLQEREALQVLLACRGDDPAQAQSLLTRFTSDWPGSAFLGKLRAACR